MYNLIISELIDGKFAVNLSQRNDDGEVIRSVIKVVDDLQTALELLNKFINNG